MEPLTIAVLKALTPSDVETEFIDDRIELPDYDTQTDLVCITVETYTAKRSYRIAARFRKRGIPVVMGGYHATICPEETEQFCDSVIVGNAETVWTQMLRDVRAGKLRKRYAGGIGTYKVKPDKSIFTGKKYLPVSLVETGRGCNHNCEFCSISRFYDSHYHARSHALIEEDITASPYKYFFLVDDNLVANRKNAIELFKRIEPLHIKWAGQGTLSMAKDPELLKAMKKSGCEIILIGFESLDKENLRQMNKSFNYALLCSVMITTMREPSRRRWNFPKSTIFIRQRSIICCRFRTRGFMTASGMRAGCFMTSGGLLTAITTVSCRLCRKKSHLNSSARHAATREKNSHHLEQS